MFSSKELISFVFAHENDTYYGDDLLKLNLNQYLWGKLHENYETIYYLSAAENKFNVRSFGDLTCEISDPGKGTVAKKLLSFIGSSEQDKLGNWMLRQLRAKPSEAVAFVCSLEDFCTVLSDERWAATLKNIAEEKKRSGIFVLTASATAESTKDLLMSSPVFDRLHETAVTDVRSGELRELYGPIKRSKWDSCLFLNTFTRERIRSLLLHLMMEYPERYQGCQELDMLADYLMLYLHDPQRQRTEPLLANNLPTSYLRYRELYAQLASETVWAKLLQQYAKFAQTSQLHSNHEYIDSVCCEVPILRDRKCYAGKCMMLRIPEWVYEQDADGIQAQKTLENIQQEVSAPKNRPENAEIVAAVEGFLSQIDVVRTGDLDTYKQLLRAVELCVCKVYTVPGSEDAERILAIIEKLQSGITISNQCFTVRHNLEVYQLHSTTGTLQEKKLAQMEQELKVLEQLRKRYIDLVNASILELTIPAATSNIMDLLDELDQEVESCEEQIPEPPIPPTQKDEFGDEFSFRPEDYIYIPPTFTTN